MGEDLSADRASADPATTIEISVAPGLSYDQVFRQERSQLFNVPAVHGAAFYFLDSPADAWQLRSALKRRFGVRGLGKTMAKLQTPIRFLYCVLEDRRVIHHGWLLVSRGPYPVGQRDVVIGPIETDPARRGRGLAAHGLQEAINAMITRGYTVFYIHTSHGNRAAQRVIAKCGFGRPVALQLRGPDSG
jgi:RimJ/RimL family protein N-acetyltransferase